MYSVNIIFLIYQTCTNLQNIPNCIHLDTSHLYGSNFVHLCSVRKSWCSLPHTFHSHKLMEKRSHEMYQFMYTTFYFIFVFVIVYEVGGRNHSSPNLLELQYFPKAHHYSIISITARFYTLLCFHLWRHSPCFDAVLEIQRGGSLGLIIHKMISLIQNAHQL